MRLISANDYNDIALILSVGKKGNAIPGKEDPGGKAYFANTDDGGIFL